MDRFDVFQQPIGLFVFYDMDGRDSAAGEIILPCPDKGIHFRDVVIATSEIGPFVGRVWSVSRVDFGFWQFVARFLGHDAAKKAALGFCRVEEIDDWQQRDVREAKAAVAKCHENIGLAEAALEKLRKELPWLEGRAARAVDEFAPKLRRAEQQAATRAAILAWEEGK